MIGFRNLPPTLPLACVAVILAYFAGMGPRAFEFGPIDLNTSMLIGAWIKVCGGLALLICGICSLVRRMIWGPPAKSAGKPESPQASLVEENVERNLAEMRSASAQASSKDEGFTIATAIPGPPIKVDIAEGRVVVRATAEQLDQFKREHPRPAPRASVPIVRRVI
jgi:hypothetical protein